MDWLNYHHLLYFWTVVREGGVTEAAKKLHLTQPTVSSQLKALELSLGVSLLEKKGRRLETTQAGRVVFEYADEIFSIGRELVETVKDGVLKRPAELHVGIADQVPKLVAFRLLRPALEIGGGLRIVCREGAARDMLAALALHELDVVVSDGPVAADVDVKAFNHRLGSCGVSVFGAPALAAKHRRSFPTSLHRAPMLLPARRTVLRTRFETWCDEHEIRPAVVGEFDDSALMKTFGQEGCGLFLGPGAIESELSRQYRVRVVGRIPEISEEFFAISGERRVQHPAVLAITRAAREALFGGAAEDPDA